MTNQSSKDILITNFHCAANRGDSAILEGLSTTLKQEISGIQTVYTEYPDASTYINNIPSKEQRTAPFRVDRPGRTAAYLMEIFGLTDLSKTARSWSERKLNLTLYNEADIVIGTGGHYLTEIYYPGKLGILWELNYCKNLGKPVILCGQSFGPVEATPYKQLTRRVLNKMDAITVRDQQSKRNLESIGVTTDIYLTADVAFAMDIDSEEKPLSDRRTEPLPTLLGNPVFTISVRDWDHFDEGGMEQYLQAVADLCDHIVKMHGGKVYLLSTCTGFDGYHTDDRVTGHKVYDKLKQPARKNVEIVTGEYTPQELVFMLEDVDLHIGTRMHSVVLSLLAGTPVVGIEYQFKTTGLMEMFDLTEYVLPIEQVTSKSLQHLFKNAYANKAKIKNQIDTNLPDVQKQAERNGKIVSSVLDSYC